ncbi:MAG: recombinase family protein [Oscillospiraceae bacterium]|nr:recombinase family protein [Oscillospiraceae bacterium]
MKKYGYIRVSSIDQNENRQKDTMAALGISITQLYVDKQSGADFDRPKYQLLIQKLKRGDLLYIDSVDRLGRNYKEILEQWRALTRDKGVDMVVLDMPLLDTRLNKDLMGTFVSDLVLQILSFVAQKEREDNKRRQAEGITAAKARGVCFGPPKKPIPENFAMIVNAWEQKQISLEQAFSQCGIGRTTFFYRLREHRQAQIDK